MASQILPKKKTGKIQKEKKTGKKLARSNSQKKPKKKTGKLRLKKKTGKKLAKRGKIRNCQENPRLDAKLPPKKGQIAKKKNWQTKKKKNWQKIGKQKKMRTH